MKGLTNTKGPLAKCSDAPGAPAAALMPDLADGLGGHKPSRGGAVPGLGLKLSCLHVGAEMFATDVAKVDTEPMFKQAPIVNLIVNSITCNSEVFSVESVHFF